MKHVPTITPLGVIAVGTVSLAPGRSKNVHAPFPTWS
jgi:hypothetical protein